MPVALYPDIIVQQDLSRSSQGFGAEVDDACQQIHDATSGWGANKNKTIEALASQDAATRAKIYYRYKEMFSKDLREVLKKEFSGDFGDALQLLSLPSDMAEACMLHKAFKGVGANADIIWSVLCARTNAELEQLKKAFYKMYDKDLGKLLASELHGDMERLVFNCLQAAEEPYNTQYHTADKAAEDAEFIHSKGQGRWGTDEKSIFKVICAAPREHIENINRAYADKYGYTLQKAMEKELSGNVRDATLHLLGMKLKPYETMAELIKTACAGLGTNELLLTCCIVRYQNVLGDVQTAHIERFGKTIHDRVRKETRGAYEKTLLCTLNAVWPEEGQ